MLGRADGQASCSLVMSNFGFFRIFTLAWARRNKTQTACARRAHTDFGRHRWLGKSVPNKLKEQECPGLSDEAVLDNAKDTCPA